MDMDMDIPYNGGGNNNLVLQIRTLRRQVEDLTDRVNRLENAGGQARTTVLGTNISDGYLNVRETPAGRIIARLRKGGTAQVLNPQDIRLAGNRLWFRISERRDKPYGTWQNTYNYNNNNRGWILYYDFSASKQYLAVN